MPNELPNKLAAIQYRELGYSIIPVGNDKVPRIEWKPFQERIATLEDIERWWDEFPAALVGIVTGPISKIMVVDCDTLDAIKNVRGRLPRGFQTVVVETPRGGRHFYFQYVECRNSTNVMPGVDVRGEGGYVVTPPSLTPIGQYQFEGMTLADGLPAPLPDSLREVVKPYAQYKQVHVFDESTMLTEPGRDEDLFHIANTLIRGGMDVKNASLVISKLADVCVPPFPAKESEMKVASAIKRARDREREVAKDVEDWVDMIEGTFTIQEIIRDLELTTVQHKNNVRKILQRLIEKGKVVKHGTHNNMYRVVDRDSQEIDFMHVHAKVYGLVWPFRLENIVEIMPKNTIVIAGEANAGKTAFLLNIAKNNMISHKIHYFSSEMGDSELKKRLEKFDLKLEEWLACDFRERGWAYEDVISPDDVNIIDFLEIFDNFYEVGGMIKRIYDRLRHGIAIIALQKNPGLDVGLGGARGLEKPRLYLSMYPNKLKIIKAKNYKGELNPNGAEIEFKLIQGAKFREDEKGWVYA